MDWLEELFINEAKHALNRHSGSGSGVTVSTVKPSGEYTELARLVADEGYTLTNGETTTTCTDTDTPEVWYEVEDTEGEFETNIT